MMTRENFDRDVEIIRQPDHTGVARRAALARLRAAALDTNDERFPWVAEYKALLHDLTTDADPVMRRAAISELAIQRDPVVQKQLHDGLLGATRLLVPAAWALQLLAYDTHGDYIEICRRFADERETEHGLRIEAVRGLAGDHESAGRLARMMTDKTEPAAIRLWGGLSLRALAPPTFARVAAQVLSAPADATSGDVRDMCAVALRTSPTLKDFL